jgi:hypothetical protein
MASDMLKGVLAFLDAYRAAFEAFDAQAIVDLYALPAHVVSDGEPVALRPFADAGACLEGVQFVLDRHRRLGVRAGRVLEFDLLELASKIAVFRLRFEFHDGAGAPLYDYHGVYTLVPKGAGWGVAAISHDQIPRLTAAVAAAAV